MGMWDDEFLKLEEELQIREAKNPVKLSYSECWSLFRFLEHGDTEHRKWLAKAIFAWALKKKRPREASYV